MWGVGGGGYSHAQNAKEIPGIDNHIFRPFVFGMLGMRWGILNMGLGEAVKGFHAQNARNGKSFWALE